MKNFKKSFLVMASVFITCVLLFSTGCKKTTTEKVYTIVWKDDNGTVLETDINVAKGTIPTYDGATPTKANTDQYTYVFDGWDSEISAATSNKTYTAKYTFATNKYTYKFFDGSTELKNEKVNYGTTIVAPSNPTKEGTAQYSYPFDGWYTEQVGGTKVTDFGTVTKNVSFYAHYTTVTNSYDITWANYDGTELEKDEDVLYGATPTYGGVTPTKPSDLGYEYTFSNWDSSISAVTGNKTYTAVYSKEAIDYSITYNLDGGNNGDNNPVEYNIETPTITLEDASKTGYTFNGWYSESTFTNKVQKIELGTTGHINLFAKFTINQYTISFYDEDGTTLLGTARVDYLKTAVYPNNKPTKDSTLYHNYSFNKWVTEVNGSTEDNLELVKEDRSVYATYKETDRYYSVAITVNEYGYGTVSIDSVNALYGAAITTNGNKVTIGGIEVTATSTINTNQYNYAFVSWEGIVSTVEDGITITAVFSRTDKENANLTFTYDSTTSTYAVSGISGDPEMITIGSTYNDGINGNHPISSIADSAFSEAANLKTLIISPSIYNIGSSAFYGSTISRFVFNEESGYYQAINGNLYSKDGSTLISYAIGKTDTTFSFPAGVTTIGAYAFAGSSFLKEVTIPEDVSLIETYAFYYSNALETINYNATNLSNLFANNNIFYHAGNNGSGITVNIGENVERIPSYLFNPDDFEIDCPKITTVNFLGTSMCESIGEYAFANCAYLLAIIIPTNIKTIEAKAFYNCSEATTITINEGVKTLSSLAFGYCNKITTINYNATSLNNLNANNYVFYYVGQNATGTIVNIGENVESIPNYLFNPVSSTSYYLKITTVNFLGTSKCTTIGQYAFNYCAVLTEITIPAGVTTIGKYAFYNCLLLNKINYNATSLNNLTANNHVFSYVGQNTTGTIVNIGENVESIPNYLFNPNRFGQNSPKITTVNFLGTSKCKTIGTYAFAYCNALLAITIPNSVTTIGTYAFYNCSLLTEVTISNNLEIIEDSVFRMCSNLEEIIMPEGITTINGYALADCLELTTIDIPASVSSLNSSFIYNTGVTTLTVDENSETFKSIDNIIYSKDTTKLYCCAPKKTSATSIPETVTSIMDKAFNGCGELTSITIPDNVETINSSAFYQCPKLTRVEIPEKVKTIGDYAFYDCETLETVVISESVTTIGRGAFQNCVALTEIAIPAGVTTIGYYAFAYCKSVVTINYNATKASDLYYGDNVFTNVGEETDGVTVNIGAKVEVIPNYLFFSTETSPKITSVNFLGTSMCESIGEYAFASCVELSEITIPASVTLIGARFINYSGISTITVDENNENYKAIDNIMYSKDGVTLHSCAPKNTITNISIPNTVTSINVNAFYGCTTITTLTIPSMVTTIDYGAFQNCENLKTVYINSAYVANELLHRVSMESLIYDATVVYVLDGLSVSNSTWLIEQYTVTTTDVTGYTKYEKKVQ